jgi:putative intracellular protease/amidase
VERGIKEEKMSKKVAVLITDEFEDSEFTSPAESYKGAGFEEPQLSCSSFPP